MRKGVLMKRVVVLFVFLVLAVGVLPVAAGYDKLVLRDMDGKTVEVDSLLKEGPVVINFWATWCGPCRVEMPHLEKIYKDLSPRGVHFAAVSLDRRTRKSSLEKFLKKNKVTLPVYVDPEGQLASRFKVKAIPTTIVLDKKAEAYYTAKGYRRGDEVLLKKKIEALLPPDEEQAGKRAGDPAKDQAEAGKSDE
jgi:thiol-disulfide isomerase/thioredoxin